MVLDNVTPEIELVEVTKHKERLRKRKSNIIKAISAVSAVFLYCSVNYYINNSEAEKINEILQTPEVVKRYSSQNLSTPTFLRDSFLSELLKYRKYAERFDTSDGRLLSSKGMKNWDKIVTAKTLAKQLQNEGASGLTDILLSATNVSSLDTIAWTPKMIRFQDAVAEVDRVINNFSYFEKTLFEKSEYAQITKILKDQGSSNSNGDYLKLGTRKKDYVLSALPAMLFEDKYMMMIVSTLWQAETKSDETASGMINPLDTGKGQFQVDTAIDYLYKLILYPEFDFMMQVLRPLDENGHPIEWSDYGKKLKANKPAIARLNRMNQNVRNLESEISQLGEEMRGKSDMHSLKGPDSLKYDARIGSKKIELASILENMKNDKEAKNVEYVYRILFEEKLQAVLTGFYVKEVFGMQLFWSTVKDYYYGSQKTKNPVSLKQATLETLYCAYINGPGDLQVLMNARRRNNYDRGQAENDASILGDVSHAIHHSVRLFYEYERIEKLARQGLFKLSSKPSGIETIYKYIVETPEQSLESLAKDKIKLR